MTDRLSTLQSLRCRVANAKGPDREIDATIADIFTPISKGRHWGYGGAEAPKVTSSIDAALAWVEKVLPGCGWTVSNADDVKPCPKAWVWELSTENRAEHFSANASTPALAITLAGLDALIAKEKTDEDHR